MTLEVELPDEVIEALGPEPQQELPEAVVLSLVSGGKLTLGRAAELLGPDRLSAIRWYTGHGLPYPDLRDADLADELASLR